MPEFLLRLKQRVPELWKDLDKSQKKRIYIISALLIAAIAASIIFATRTEYAPLIKSSDSKEISEMTKTLDEQNIKFKLVDNNSTILINSKDNDKAKVALIQAGYPKSGMTFEDAFSLIKINTTESDKKKLWKHYDESVLSNRLKMLADNIEEASVTISKPDGSEFVVLDDSNKEEASANVIIKPKSELTPKQVQGIVMMVASSVEGLDPEKVTVLDNNLNILNNNSSEDGIEAASTQYEMKEKTQKALETSVYNLYNKVPLDSFESLRVVVNPVLDFNKLKTQTSDITNGTGMDGGAVISTKEIKENLVNGNTSDIPGTDTNPGNGTTTYPTGSDGKSTYNKTDKTTNYEYQRIMKDEEKALGIMDFEKSSMTVALYYGRRVKSDANLTQVFIDQLKSDVSRATGISVANISVNKYKLAPEEIVTKPMTDTIKELVSAYGFFALILLLIIGLLIAAIPRKKRVKEQEFVPAAETAGGPNMLENGLRFIVPEPTEPIPEINTEERSEVKKQIEKFVKQKPDAVAQLLRNWLSDDWE